MGKKHDPLNDAAARIKAAWVAYSSRKVDRRPGKDWASLEEMAEELECTRQAARGRLKKLSAIGQVEIRKVWRDVYYRFSPSKGQ